MREARGIAITWTCAEPEPGPFRDSLLAAAATVAERYARAIDAAAFAECYAECAAKLGVPPSR